MHCPIWSRLKVFGFKIEFVFNLFLALANFPAVPIAGLGGSQLSNAAWPYGTGMVRFFATWNFCSYNCSPRCIFGRPRCKRVTCCPIGRKWWEQLHRPSWSSRVVCWKKNQNISTLLINRIVTGNTCLWHWPDPSPALGLPPAKPDANDLSAWFHASREGSRQVI